MSKPITDSSAGIRRVKLNPSVDESLPVANQTLLRSSRRTSGTGNLAGLVNGNMLCGLFGSGIGARPDAEGRAELPAIPEAGPIGPWHGAQLPPQEQDVQEEHRLDDEKYYVERAMALVAVAGADLYRWLVADPD